MIFTFGRMFLVPAVSLIHSIALGQEKTNELNYTVRFIREQLEVRLTVNTNDCDSLVLAVPEVWGEHRKWEYLNIGKIKGAVAVISADSTRMTLFPGRNKKAEIHYSVRGAVPGNPEQQQEYLPFVREQFLTVFAHSLFFSVEDSLRSTTDFTLTMSGIPEKYKGIVHSGFGTIYNNRPLKMYGIPNTDVQNTILVAGDYRIHEQLSATGLSVKLAVRGEWQFSDKVLLDLLVSTVDQQRNFWNDYSTKNYFVTLSPDATTDPADEYSYSAKGTGLRHSFAVTSTNGKGTTLQRLGYMFHHELMHHWIGTTIRNAADEELSYWFSEGFTDYFTYSNMRESGVISDSGYYATLDSLMKQHYGNDRCSAPNTLIREQFFTDPYIGKLPYHRGALFALLLDARIRKANEDNSLKTVMQHMLEEAKQSSGHYRVFERKWLEQEVIRLAGFSITDWIDMFIVAGKPIPPEVFNEFLEKRISEKECKVFGTGFSYEKNALGSYTITEVLSGSGAEEAGVRAGEQLTGYNIYGNTAVQSSLELIRDGETVPVGFYPFVVKKVPQFE